MPGHSDDDDSSGQNFHGQEESEDAAAFDDTETIRTRAAGEAIGDRRHNDMPPDEENGNDQDPLLGQTIEGRYLIIELIGRGGMGAVYRARQLLLDKIVALKVVRPESSGKEQALLRFLHEGKAAMELSHENIVTIREFGQSHDGILYLAMDLIEGKSLKAIIARESPLSQERITAIALQICSALHHAHTHGVVHRDIKPANILLTKDPGGQEIVKLFDFGVAKLQFEDMKITKTGALVGTPTYMSPEQVTGSQPDARSDIYAVGCTLFEMITGHPPFRAEASMDTFMKHLNDPVPAIERKDVSPDLIAIVNRCLSKDPIDRYSSAGELKDELEKLKLQTKPGIPTIPGAPHKSSRWPLFVVLMSILLVATAVVVYARFTQGTPIRSMPAERPDEIAVATKRPKLDRHTHKLLADKWRRAYGASQSAFNTGKYDLAQRNIRECLSLSDNFENLSYKSSALAILADLAYVSNDPSLNESYIQAYLKATQLTQAHVNVSRWLDEWMRKYRIWRQAPEENKREITVFCENCNKEAEQRISRGFLLEALEILSVPLKLQSEFEISADIKASTLTNYGIALARHNSNKQALQILEQALDLYKSNNLRPASLGRTYYTIALCQVRLKNLSLAEKNSRLALELDRALLGPTHPMVVADLAQLAGICHSANKKAEAERLWSEVVLTCNNGQAIAYNMENIPALMAYGASLRGLKRLNDSISAYERTLSFAERAVWKNDTVLLIPIFNNLDATLSKTGESNLVGFHRARVQAMKSRYERVMALKKSKIGR